jgi:hypothetical protein
MYSQWLLVTFLDFLWLKLDFSVKEKVNSSHTKSLDFSWLFPDLFLTFYDFSAMFTVKKMDFSDFAWLFIDFSLTLFD